MFKPETPSAFFGFRQYRFDGVVNNFLKTLMRMLNLVEEIDSLNSLVRIVCNTSAVEASRSASLLGAFESLAVEVETMVNRSEETTVALENSTRALLFSVLQASGVLLSEQARDIIDKIDRNLFERNCDCQAWATFPDNLNCLLDPSEESVKKACKLLAHICHIYEVYSDILLLNRDGVVVATANRPEIMGRSCVKEDWFRECIKGVVHVTDVYYCELVQGYVVSYCAPVRDEHGDIIGIVSTRFNWNFAREMIEHARVTSGSEIWIVSQDGTLLASRNRGAVLQDNCTWLSCGQMVADGLDGFSVETNRNGENIVTGGARTRGYNNYAGKGWSAIVAQPLELVDPVRFSYTFEPSPADKVWLDAQKPVDHERSVKNLAESAAQSEPRKLIRSDVANENLRATAANIQTTIEQINRIHFDTLLMSLNASVKSERAGEEGRALSVISNQIRLVSVRSKEITDTVNAALATTMEGVDLLVQEKVKDAAWDAIDKVDRNLFERNCDVQAWTIFQEVVDCALKGVSMDKTRTLLENLHRIYEIYDDIFLVDLRGSVICAAIRQGAIGTDFSQMPWFQETVRGQVSVTDMYYSEETGNYTVAYSAPVLKDGRIVGVLSTRFSWKFIYDILDKTLVPEGSTIELLNSEGLVIAAGDREGVLEKSYAGTDRFALAQTGEPGVYVKRDESGHATHYIGYAKTRGYNRYKGKGWIVLVTQPVKSSS